MAALPEGHEEYVEAVIEKIREFIRSGLWSAVRLDDCSRWFENFPDAASRFVAAVLADRLIYYSEYDVWALVSWAFDEAVRRICLDGLGTGIPADALSADIEWAKAYRKVQRSVLVCPGSPNVPSSSGYTAVRSLLHQERIVEGQQCLPHQIRDRLSSGKYCALVIVDDMLGSGSQALNFFQNTKQVFKGCTESIEKTSQALAIPVYLAVGVATERGLALIRKASLVPVAAETLTEEWDVYDKAFWSSYDYASAVSALQKLANDNGIRRKGYRDLSLSVSFHHGTPNVTCPIYWQDEKTWHPLVRRYPAGV